MTDWDGIDEFVAVARTQSFSQAAKRLKRSTSQVSRDVARLEDRLGARLLYRTTRQVSLTDAGAQFLEGCLRMLEARDEAVRSVRADSEALQGHLRVTCSVAYGERFIVPLVNSFMALHPRLSVEIELTDQTLDLAGGAIDLAVRTGVLKSSGLIATRMTSRTRVLCAAPAYLDGHEAPADIEDLRRHACLIGAADVWAFERSGRPVHFRPTGRWRCNNGSAVLDATLSGLGVCQLPDFYVAQAIRAERLVRLLPTFEPADEGVWGVYVSRKLLPPKVTRLIEHLRSGLNCEITVPDPERPTPAGDFSVVGAG
jgi:DNA-binding transcriptional LysR family regulator